MSGARTRLCHILTLTCTFCEVRRQRVFYTKSTSALNELETLE